MSLDEKLPVMPKWKPYHRIKYSELRDLEPDALISDLQKIVIDYAVHIKDYEVLKQAFTFDLINKINGSYEAFITDPLRALDNLEENEIEKWRRKLLYQNKEIDIITITCNDCHLDFRSNKYGWNSTLWNLPSYWCINGGHEYYLCFECDYWANPERNADMYHRSCGYH
jgi:hypothetical protein